MIAARLQRFGSRRIASTWLSAMLMSSGLGASASDIDRERFNPIVASIAKIEVVTEDGSYSLGSGVAVQPGRFVTSCHVTAKAASISVLYQGLRWPVSRQRANTLRDLCLLQVRGLDDVVPVPRGKVGDLHVGTEVAAIGYTFGTGLATQVGTVQALHPIADGTVIQSATYFNSGASGGGLFLLDGRLVGILTFRLKGAEAYYFSIPVDWIESELLRSDPFEPVGKLEGPAPFWSQPVDRLPYFMQAATLQARALWDELLTLAHQWSDHEPKNAEAWLMKGQALIHLDRRSEAVDAYEHALALDTGSAQTCYLLGQLKTDLNQDTKKIMRQLETLDPALAAKLAAERGSHRQPASEP